MALPSAQPWIKGIAESLAAAKLVMNSNLATRNRHALILLDSALEIAFKEFLVYIVGIKNLEDVHTDHRDVLHRIVKRHTNFDKTVWDSVEFFYERRCNLYHEDAASTIGDGSILDFFELVIWMVNKLFGVEVQTQIQGPDRLLGASPAAIVDVNGASSQIEAVVVAMHGLTFGSPSEVGEKLGELGYRRRLTPTRISSLMSNASYRHLFHLDRKSGRIALSAAGEKRYMQLADRIGDTHAR